MADRAPLQIIIHDAPANQHQAIVEILRKYDLRFNFDEPAGPLSFDSHYGDHEVALGAINEIQDDLLDRAPGATWKMWQDPKYEYPGQLAMYTPEWGLWLHDCDAEGNATFSPNQIQQLLASRAEEQRVALGTPWQEAMTRPRGAAPALPRPTEEAALLTHTDFRPGPGPAPAPRAEGELPGRDIQPLRPALPYIPVVDWSPGTVVIHDDTDPNNIVLDCSLMVADHQPDGDGATIAILSIRTHNPDPVPTVVDSTVYIELTADDAIRLANRLIDSAERGAARRE